MDDPKTFEAIFREELEGDDFGNGSDGLRPGAVPPGANEDTISASIDKLKTPPLGALPVRWRHPKRRVRARRASGPGEVSLAGPV